MKRRENCIMCHFLFKVMGLGLFFPSLYHREWVKYVCSEPERANVRVEVGSFYHAHSGELLRRKQGRSALVLDATRRNSWTFTCVQLFAVSWLLLRKKLGDYLEIMNAYRCALPYCSSMLLRCPDFCVWWVGCCWLRLLVFFIEHLQLLETWCPDHVLFELQLVDTGVSLGLLTCP
jgi:hypothetical protein